MRGEVQTKDREPLGRLGVPLPPEECPVPSSLFGVLPPENSTRSWASSAEAVTEPAASAPDGLSARRPFRAIVCDWDGTAVVDRQEDARPLAALVSELLRLGVWFVVVTGTNFGHVDRQLVNLIAPTLRRRLVACTNRGSEVYGFDVRGKPVRRWMRRASAYEDRVLTEIADSVRDAIRQRTGLDIEIVYDRLNRRKIDLIPLPAWADPPKSAMGDLLAAVEHRLRGAGLAGGLGEAVALTHRLAEEHGLRDARITSDVKHVEVGLTDKGDSLAWIADAIVRREALEWSDILIAGDEFGPVAGFAGSDDLLRSGADGAVVVSVGPEPGGAPSGVLHVGGGSVMFRQLLAEQVRLLRAAGAARWADADARLHGPVPVGPPLDPAWRMDEEGYEPTTEHPIESRFAVSNGYLGVRGSLEIPTRTSRPRTFVAGFFDASHNEPVVPMLVQAPNWLRLRLFLDGEQVSRSRGETLEYTRTLDFRHGLLWTDWRQHDRDGNVIRLRTLRFVSMVDRSVAVQVAQLQVARPGQMAFEAVIDRPWTGVTRDRVENELTLWRTPHRGRLLAVASGARLRVGARTLQPLPVQFNSATGDRWAWHADPDEPATMVKFVAMVPGDGDRDRGDVALTALRRTRREGWRRHLASHSRAWGGRWALSDVEIEGNEEAQRALRFAVYHLNSAANPDDERVSIGARALTGEAYLGHVFWDTEIFMLPFYTFTWPAAARALLMYRYHTLDAARAKAAEMGCRGALYAWESADDGEEATPPYVTGPHGQVIMIKNGTLEQHISADVAYAVWQYWQASGDAQFLLDAGAEIILETARFWASRADLGEDGCYHIRHVIGPDEYHEDVDDNAYTNGLAQWNIDRAVEVADILETHWPERWSTLASKLGITTDDLREWAGMARRLITGIDPDSRLIEQFAGFFELDPVFISGYSLRTAPMDVVLGAEKTRRSQVSKQADVVMLLHLLWDRFSPQVREANFRYYEARCGHGSSLSPVVHAMVAARLGDVSLADRYFEQAAAIDFDDAMGNAALGMHIGALAGLWQVAVFGYAGMALREDGLAFEPRLPGSWGSLRFPVQWRGRRLRVTVHNQPRSFTALLEEGGPLTVSLNGLTRTLSAGESWTCHWDELALRWTESPR